MTNTRSEMRSQFRYAALLTRELVITDFKVKYQSSFLGYMWSLLRPLFMFTITYIFFGIFIGAGGGIPHYPAYLLLGMVLWTFVAEVTSAGVGAVKNQASMLRKLYFPKYVVVLAVSITASINLVFNLGVVTIFMVVGGSDIRWQSLLVIPLLLELAVLAVGLAFFLSALYVKFHDTAYIWEILLQAGIYITPVIYLIQFVHNKSPLVAQILLANPIAQVIQDARYLLITRQTWTTSDLYSTGWYRLVPITVDVVMAALAVLYFKRQAPSFAEEV